MSLSCKMSLFIYKYWRNKRQDSVFTSFFFYFSDMHLHAYSKANYQTHTNTLCHLHELQIISGTSVQIRTEKQIFPRRESEEQNRGEGRTKSKSLARGRPQLQALQPSSAATKPGDYSLNRPASKYHSRCFVVVFVNLPGRGSP